MRKNGTKHPELELEVLYSLGSNQVITGVEIGHALVIAGSDRPAGSSVPKRGKLRSRLNVAGF
jgi:hypothetical protein